VLIPVNNLRSSLNYHMNLQNLILDNLLFVSIQVSKHCVWKQSLSLGKRINESILHLAFLNLIGKCLIDDIGSRSSELNRTRETVTIIQSPFF